MLTFNHTCIGYSHIQSGKPCQDASYSNSNAHMAIAIVSDGHGGQLHIRSDVGAQLAIEAAREIIEITPPNQWHNPIEREELFEGIVSLWKLKVNSHYIENPQTEEEQKVLYQNISDVHAMPLQNVYMLYGCTLLAACRYADGWFAFQIGDGRCVILHPGDKKPASEPIEKDPRCFMFMTSSMCDINAETEFRYTGGTGKDIPYAIFVGTDGIENSWGVDEALHSFYMDMVKYCSSYEKIIEELKESLPKLSQKGCKDDMSVAAIVDTDNLEEKIKDIYQFQIDECRDLLTLNKQHLQSAIESVEEAKEKLKDDPDNEFLQRDLENCQYGVAQQQLGRERVTRRLNRLLNEFK